MNFFFSLLYLATSWCSACLFTNTQTLNARSEPAPHGLRLIVWIICCASFFFIPFYIIGSVSLFNNLLKVTLPNLLAIEIVLLGLVILYQRHVIKTANIQKHHVALFFIPRISSTNTLLQKTIYLLCLLILFLSCLTIIGFPTGYEARNYHLTSAIHIFNTGSLLPWSDAFMYAYPLNMSLYLGFFLNFAPERIVSILNLPSLLLLSYILFQFGKLLLCDIKSRLLIILSLFSIPIFFFQAVTVGPDLYGIAFLGLAFLCCLIDSDDNKFWPIFSGLAAGLAFGFKSLHLIGAAYLGVIIILKSILFAHPIMPTLLRNCLIFTAGFLITAGFWLLRNGVEFSNPLYPIYFDHLFDWLNWQQAPDVDFNERNSSQFEWVRKPQEWLFYPWIEWHYINQNFKASAGLGPFFAGFVPIAGCVALLTLVSKFSFTKAQLYTRFNKCLFSLFTLLSTSIFTIAIWWYLNDRQPRYLITSLLFMLPVVGWMINQMTGSTRRILEISALISILFTLGLFVLTQLIDFGSHFVISKQFSRAEFYEYPSDVDSLPTNSKILNLSTTPMNFALLGKHHKNQVVPESAIAINNFNTNTCSISNNCITYTAINQLNITHIYSDSPFTTDSCIKLTKIDQLSHNPHNKIAFLYPRTLFLVKKNNNCYQKNRIINLLP